MIKIKEKTIVSAVTLLSSLATYFYAKQNQKDAIPYMMVGGFVGAVLGEAIVFIVIKDKNENEENKKSLGKGKGQEKNEK